MNFRSLFAVLLLISTSMLMSQANSVQGEELCYFKEKPLNEALQEIRAKTGINFVYHDNLIANVRVDGRIKKSSIENDLNKILLGSGFGIKEFGNNSIVLYPKKKKQQEKHIEAYVVNEPAKENVDSVYSNVDAELLTNMELDYPVNAVRNREHGKVHVKVLVNNEGGVCKSVIQESSGSQTLDSVAIDYTKKLRFIPASTNGKTRSSWVRIIFKYFLTEK